MTRPRCVVSVFALLCLCLVQPNLARADDGDELLEQAGQYWESQQYEEAAQAYRRLRDEFPHHAFVRSGDAQFWLFCSLGNAGETKEEIRAIRRFLRDFPEQPSCGYAMYFLGAAHRKAGDEEKARQAWETLLEKYPDDSMADHARLALASGQAGRPEETFSIRDTLALDFIDYAEGAARWLQAIAVEENGGLKWPQYGGTRAYSLNFYEGSAGIALFFLNLYRITAEEDFATLARKAARTLIDRAEKDENGLHWTDEDEWDDGSLQQYSSPALYVGAAGIGHLFLCLYREFEEDRYLEHACGAADCIVATSEKDGNGRHWGQDTDIISGVAGIGLFLLDLYEATKKKGYLEGAEAGAAWLIAHAVEDGEGLKWKSATTLDRFYTGFSHGTAGIAYYLARVAEVTGKKTYLQHAEKGARWLIDKALASDGGVKWFHYEPGHEDVFQAGWCHGPAGTGRVFLELYRLTGKPEYLEVAEKGAAWIRATLDPTSRDTVFHGLSMCCGAAGIGDFFLDLFSATRRDEYLEYAAAVGRHLMRQAKTDGEGYQWTNYDQPDETGKFFYGTGHMIGVAGTGTFLLKLYAFCSNLELRFLPFSDKPMPIPSEPPAEEGKGYLVLTNLPETDPYMEAARRIAAHHNTRCVRFDTGQLVSLRRRLTALKPRYVTLVLKPRDIDANLHRRLMAISTRMDRDPFCDFAYGFITGETAKDAIAFVDGIIEMQKKELPRTYINTSVSSGGSSQVSEGIGIPLLAKLGYTGKDLCWSCVENDPDVLEFVGKHLEETQGQGIVSFGGCGDPESIWLFADGRNCDPSKHWPFDPERVGYDPEGEMPRITANYFRELDLSPAVVWSGTCHSGVLVRAFVEDDIVSTFGTVDCVTEYFIPEGRSLGLAILSCRPTAFLAPIGANHGYACLTELYRAVATGWPLGEVMRSRYNEIIFAAGGQLDIQTYEPGAPLLAEDVMRGGGANRLLYGDPLYAPFAPSGRDYLLKTRRPFSGRKGFLLRCKVVDDVSFAFWDMFGNDSEKPERIYTTVELNRDDEVARVSATASSPDGQEIPISAATWLIEEQDGRRLLHLQANAARETLSRTGVVVEFTVLCESE